MDLPARPASLTRRGVKSGIPSSAVGVLSQSQCQISIAIAQITSPRRAISLPSPGPKPVTTRDAAASEERAAPTRAKTAGDASASERGPAPSRLGEINAFDEKTKSLVFELAGEFPIASALSTNMPRTNAPKGNVVPLVIEAVIGVNRQIRLAELRRAPQDS